MKKQIFFGVLILGTIFIIILKENFFDKQKQVQVQEKPVEQIESDDLKIISTSPDPLEGATILPTQNIEFKFNKQISEFKHRFDPEVDHEIEAAYDSTDKTTTIKIIFKKPLILGSGYTLFVLSNTNSVDKIELGRQYDYHFSTIKYKGV